MNETSFNSANRSTSVEEQVSENDNTFFKRLHKAFLRSLDTAHAHWTPELVLDNTELAKLYLKDIGNYLELFQNIGRGSEYKDLNPMMEPPENNTGLFELAKGLNIDEYTLSLYKNDPSAQQFFSDLERIVLRDTGLPISACSVWDPFDIRLQGKKLSNNKLVFPLTLKLAYNMYTCQKLFSRTKHIIVLEIGAGIGCLPYLFTQNRPKTTYIIVDIPHTAAISSFFLHKSGKDVCLHGEYLDLEPDTLKKHDYFIIPPKDIKLIPDHSVDLVINVDSFSEMDDSTVQYYFDEVSRICKQYFYLNNIRCLFYTKKPYADFIDKNKYDILYSGSPHLSVDLPRESGLPLSVGLGHEYKEMILRVK